VIAASRFDIERKIELPPPIVWDALVDPDLVAGWLAGAGIDLRVGGRYDLIWQRDGVRRVGPGVITELREGRLLTVLLRNTACFPSGSPRYPAAAAAPARSFGSA
jgi:uncharacterized protein YndB with AHSA1/START domain